MVTAIHSRQVDHVANAGNADNNSVFDDIVKQYRQQYQREQDHQNLFSFIITIVVKISYNSIEYERRNLKKKK